MTGRGSAGPTQSWEYIGEYRFWVEGELRSRHRIVVDDIPPQVAVDHGCVSQEQRAKEKPLEPSECRRKPGAGSPRPTTP